MKTLKIFPVLLACYEMLAYLSNDMYLPALPQMTTALSTTPLLTQMSLTTWFLGAVSMQLGLGPLSDKYGRKPILLWGGLVFVIATLMCAFTSNIYILLIARFFQGCAVCSVAVAGYAAIHELYDQKEAMKTLALMGSITVLAPAFGPLLGSVVLKLLSWRDIFGLLAILAIVVLSMLYKWMPETLAPEKRHPIEMKTIKHHYSTVIKNKNFMLTASAFCATFSAMIAWIAMGPFLVIDAFHYSPFMFGVFQAMVFGSFIIGTRCVNLGLSHFKPTKLIHIAVYMNLFGATLSLIFALAFQQTLLCFIIALMIFAFSSALSFAPLQRLAIEASAAPMGARMAILSSMMSGSGTIGSLAAGYFYFGTPVSLACITFISALAALGCVRYREIHRTELNV